MKMTNFINPTGQCEHAKYAQLLYVKSSTYKISSRYSEKVMRKWQNLKNESLHSSSFEERIIVRTRLFAHAHLLI